MSEETSACCYPKLSCSLHSLSSLFQRVCCGDFLCGLIDICSASPWLSLAVPELCEQAKHNPLVSIVHIISWRPGMYMLNKKEWFSWKTWMCLEAHNCECSSLYFVVEGTIAAFFCLVTRCLLGSELLKPSRFQKWRRFFLEEVQLQLRWDLSID
jgi:hypothetical protein